MIARLTGRVTDRTEEGILIDIGGVGYELLLPAHTAAALEPHPERELTFHTIHYLEGQPGGAHLTPKLIGFSSMTDRAFFTALTRVKGISMRKALRAMSVPTAQLAAAIEAGDVRLLTSLPEIGKTTAVRLVNELHGKLGDMPLAGETAPPTRLNEAQTLAVDILVQWGDRRADAERWVAQAVEADASLAEPDAIVRAAYRVKERVR